MARFRFAVQVSGVVGIEADTPEEARAALLRNPCWVGTDFVCDREVDVALLGEAVEHEIQPVDTYKTIGLVFG